MPSTIQTVGTEGFTIATDGRKVLIDKSMPACRATRTDPNWDAIRDPKEPVAVDCEFQEYRRVGAVKWEHRIGRVAIVNTRGETVYDTYVRYDYDAEVSVKLPPRRFNVTWKDLAL